MLENQGIPKTNKDGVKCNDEQTTFSNPNCSELDSETLTKLKGDAIGDTLYSESFVVKTLMQLQGSVEWSKTLEEELCFLWDATMEEDVCTFLIKLSYPSIICSLINTSNEARLIEILIGILANICSILDNKDIVNDKEVDLILSMFSSDDPLILVQVARFLKAVLYSAESVTYINEDILEKINFILLNTVNNDLITIMLDAVSKLTAYNKIDAALLKGYFIKSASVAYQTFCKNNECVVNMSAFIHFLQIVSNISTYINECSSETISTLEITVQEYISEFLLEVEQLLCFFAEEENLLPLEEQLVYIVDTLVAIFQILHVKYYSSIFKSILNILSSLIKNDFEDIQVFLELFCYLVFIGECEEIKHDLSQISKNLVLPVLIRIKNESVDYQFDYKTNLNCLCDEYVKK